MKKILMIVSVFAIVLISGINVRAVEDKTSLTLIKNDGPVLPIKMGSGARVVIFGEDEAGLSTLENVMNRLAKEGKIDANSEYDYFSHKSQKVLNDEMKSAIKDSDAVLVSADAPSDFFEKLAEYARAEYKRTALIYTGELDEVYRFTAADGIILTYGAPEDLGYYMAFGGASPVGTLPEDITDDTGKVIYPQGFGLREDFSTGIGQGSIQNPVVLIVVIIIVGAVIFLQTKRINKNILNK